MRTDAGTGVRGRRWIVAFVAFALVVALLPSSPAGAQSDGRVADFNLYIENVYTGMQPGDYLKWEPPRNAGSLPNSAATLTSYTVESRWRYDAGWTAWTHLATVYPSHDPAIFEITNRQPACTDWGFRVRANYDNAASGPWAARVSRLTPRRAPSAPSLDITHRGTVAKSADTTDAASVLALTAKWPLAYCQTDYEVYETKRTPGRLYNVNLNWSPWTKVAPEVTGDGDTPEESVDGSTGTQYTHDQNFDRRGRGYGLAVRVRNRVGWSNWSYIWWTWGFRVTCADCGWINISRGDLS